MMRQGANRCLGMENFDKRAKCFDDISRPVSQKYGNEFFENGQCRPGLNQLKAEVEGKEKAKFPKQGSAIEAHRGDHGGGDHHGPGGPDNRRPPRSYSAAECKDGVGMMRKGANRCLKRKNFNKRAKCFDDISRPVSKKYGHDFFEGPSCRPGMDQLKQEVLAQEKAKYPKQSSALEARRGGDDNRGPGGPGGQPRTYSPKECKDGVAMMRKGANRCLKRKNFNKRAKCFDNISKPVSKKYGHDFFEGPSCRPGMDQLKQEVLAQEKAKYPKQGSALEARRGGDNRGPGGPGGQPRTYSPKECKDGVAMMRKGANRCLKRKNFNKRAKCFDDISRPVSKKYGHDFFEGPSCRPGMDQLKQEVLAQEKAKYPKQGSALEAHRGDHGDDNRGGDNRGGSNMKFSDADCKKGVGMIEKRANKCLKRKKFAKRKNCMDKVTDPVEKKWGSAFFESDSCRPMLDGLKQRIKDQEKAKYPKQESALD